MLIFLNKPTQCREAWWGRHTVVGIFAFLECNYLFLFFHGFANQWKEIYTKRLSAVFVGKGGSAKY